MGTQGLQLFAHLILSASGCLLSPVRGEFFAWDRKSTIFGFGKIWRHFRLTHFTHSSHLHPDQHDHIEISVYTDALQVFA